MSTKRRLVSGSLASWGRILITFVSQVALVPVYLGKWNVETYGIWLSIQGVIAIISTLDKGHQDYLGFEFLQKKTDQIDEFRKILWSGVWITFALGILQVLFLAGLVFGTNYLAGFWFDANTTKPALLAAAGIVLILYGVNWLINSNVLGLLGRVVAPFGYYPRMAWWGVIYATVTSIAPVVAVVMGAGLLGAGIALTLSTLACGIAQGLDVVRIIRRLGLSYSKPSLKLGWKNFVRSILLSAKSLLENLRQQGIRVILLPIAGPAGLAVFSTVRTGANVALQGLNAVTYPMLPELMRFLNNKDQTRSEVSFATIWIVLIVLLAPGVVILQCFAGPLFDVWTRGKIVFDPALFALLSLGVLVYALAQPAVAISMGNNLLRAQMIIAFISAVVLLTSIWFLASRFGLVGSGVALLLAEIISAYCYQRTATNWLNRNGLRWSHRPYRVAILSIVLTSLVMLAMVRFPHYNIWILLGSVPCYVFLWVQYWHTLPELATNIIRNNFARFYPRLKA